VKETWGGTGEEQRGDNERFVGEFEAKRGGLVHGKSTFLQRGGGRVNGEGNRQLGGGRGEEMG